MAKTIKQEIIFNASPREIYRALMDSKQHAEFTGAPANVSQEIGGKVTAHGDYVDAENLELEPDKTIVQKWRASDWPDGHYSILTLKLTDMDGKTKLAMTHENVPDDQADSIDQGWHDYYWTPLKKFLE